MMVNRDKKQSGEIILFVIFVIIFLMMFVSLFLSKTLARQSKSASGIVNSVQAFYIADSGTESALYDYMNICNADNPVPDCFREFDRMGSDADCSIIFNDDTMGMSVIGTYKGQTSRAIELTWTSCFFCSLL